MYSIHHIPISGFPNQSGDEISATVEVGLPSTSDQFRKELCAHLSSHKKLALRIGMDFGEDECPLCVRRNYSVGTMAISGSIGRLASNSVFHARIECAEKALVRMFSMGKSVLVKLDTMANWLIFSKSFAEDKVYGVIG
ncbi:hypothetical protein Nepgr_011845 [Nepenthes gracilis]|uniref:Uncharacterized protein n=1 Tax=Nepenthes gracilis TaxID=150966 RepID=A0AAD3XMM7_NEPGR|nr:hypothetical protein Nepgr_011845 [Nepenthes gracilis]